MNATHDTTIAPFTISSDSPERGWEPFLDWLRSHDLDPSVVRAVTIAGDQGTAQVYETDTDGLRRVKDNEPVLTEHTFAVHTAPPRRIQTLPEA